MKVGIFPRKSSRVCNLTADLVERNSAQGKTDRHRSIVDESSAYTVLSRSRAKSSPAIQGTCNLDQGLGEICVNAPVAHLVGVGECICGKPRPGGPYDRVSNFVHAGRLQYRASFPDRPIDQRPYTGTGRGSGMSSTCDFPGIAGHIAGKSERGDGRTAGKK